MLNRREPAMDALPLETRLGISEIEIILRLGGDRVEGFLDGTDR